MVEIEYVKQYQNRNALKLHKLKGFLCDIYRTPLRTFHVFDKKKEWNLIAFRGKEISIGTYWWT